MTRFSRFKYEFKAPPTCQTLANDDAQVGPAGKLAGRYVRGLGACQAEDGNV